MGKLLMMFGPRDRIELYTSRALMLQGYPTQKRATVISRWRLLWSDRRRLCWVIHQGAFFKPLREIALCFPYPTPPAEFTDTLDGVIWSIIDG